MLSNRQSILWLGHMCSEKRMLLNMNAIMVRACVFWVSWALEHARYCGLGWCALGNSFSWLGGSKSC